MAKILLLLVVCAAVYLVVRAYARTIGRSQSDKPKGSAEEDMVRCAHCGVHLPRSESAQSGEAHFCSEEHRRLHDPGA